MSHLQINFPVFYQEQFGPGLALGLVAVSLKFLYAFCKGAI